MVSIDPTASAKPSATTLGVGHHKPVVIQVRISRPGPKTLMIGLALAFGLTATSALYFLTRQPPTLPSELTDQISFPVFLPRALPSGYTLNVDDAKFQAGVLTTTAEHGDETLIISQQPRPSSFDIKDISKQGVSEASQLSSPLGDAITGKIGVNPAGILATDSTLVIISSPSGASRDDIAKTIKGLRKL